MNWFFRKTTARSVDARTVAHAAIAIIAALAIAAFGPASPAPADALADGDGGGYGYGGDDAALGLMAGGEEDAGGEGDAGGYAAVGILGDAGGEGDAGGYAAVGVLGDAGGEEDAGGYGGDIAELGLMAAAAGDDDDAELGAMAVGGMPFAEVFGKAADPDTSNADDCLRPSTIENGRIWTDKTVGADGAWIYDAAGRPTDVIVPKPDEFLVTLSALSQSYTIDTVVEPTDTVFVIDISASMFINKLDNGKSRVETMVEALNGAIAMIMEGNPNNRVAVVAFGGDSGSSRIVPILRLGHHVVRDGNYFSMRSAAYIQVSTQIPDESLYDPANRAIRVNGGTPTQRGIHAGAMALLDNADTTYTYMDKGEPVTVTRKPNIILLSDGGATMGWTDYRFELPGSDSDGGFDCGDANTTDMGISVLTVATAAYAKQRVHDHYYGPDDASKSAGFYTIGFCIKGTGADAPAVLDPANNADKASRVYLKETYNMKALLDEFVGRADGGVVTFPALDDRSGKDRRLVGIANTGNYVNNYHYTDGYFEAEDAEDLEGALQTITQKIVTTGTYSTKVGSGDADFDGYLTFADVLGEYAEFKGAKGMWFNNRKYDGHLFAQDMQDPSGANRAKFIEAMRGHLSDGAGGGLTEAQAASLLASSLAAGKANGGLYYSGPSDYGNKVTYYANWSGNWVANYFSGSGAAETAPADARCVVEMYVMEGTVQDPVSGENTDIMDIAFHVATALQDGVFEFAPPGGGGGVGDGRLARSLKAGQQMAIWYIPASLIPMRTVSAKYGDAGDAATGVQIKEASPIRYVYAVGLRGGLELEDVDDAYKDRNRKIIPGIYDTGRVNFYTNDWLGGAGAGGGGSGVGAGGIPQSLSMAFFQPGDENPYYFYTDRDADATGTVPLYVADGSGGWNATASPYAAGTQYYTMRLCFDAEAPGYLKEEYTPVDEAATPILGKADVPYVAVRSAKSTAYGTRAKANDATETGPYAADEYLDVAGGGAAGGAAADGAPYEVHLLGNNGRLSAPYAEIYFVKMWYFPGGALAKDELLQLYRNGTPYGDPAPMPYDGDPTDSEYAGAWKGLPVYQLAPDAAGNAVFNEYAIAEGVWDGAEFIPYMPLGGAEPGFAVYYKQPVWDATNGWWEEADIVNYEANNICYLTIEKELKGDVPEWEADATDIDFQIKNLGDSLGWDNRSPSYVKNFINGKFYYQLSAGYEYEIIEIDKGSIDGYANTFSVSVEATNPEEIDVGFTGDGDGIILGNLQANQYITVTFTNEYTDERFFDLTVEKVFEGDPLGSDPTDMAFEVVGENAAGAEIYRNTLYFDDFMYNDASSSWHAPDDALRLRPGSYTVTEVGGEMDGYSRTVEADATETSGTPAHFLGDAVELDAAAGESYNVVFTNKYEENHALAIEKTIVAPDDSIDPSDIVFEIVGTDGSNTIYKRSIGYGEFGDDGRYVIEDAPRGSYTVTESGGHVPGYDMSASPADAVAADLRSGDALASFTNTYTPQANPVPPALTVAKQFIGLEPSQYPQDIYFEIAGQDVEYAETMGAAQFTRVADDYIVYRAAPSGLGLPVGTYTVTEIGGEVGGYARQVNHASGFTLRLGYEDDETVIFANTYDAIPASITIEKRFIGLAPEEYPDVAFSIVGVGADGAGDGADGNGDGADGGEIYNDIIHYSDFVDGKYVIGGLAPGTYTVTESGAEAPGKALAASPAAGHTVVLDYGDEATAPFVNAYDMGGANPNASTGGATHISGVPNPSGAGEGGRADGGAEEDDGVDGDGGGSTLGVLTDAHIWYIRGYTDNTIRPGHDITRAEIAMVFYRLLDPKLKAAAAAAAPPARFVDVAGDEWYGLAINLLASHGILNGYSDGSYKPSQPITRAEFAAVVSRFDSLADDGGANPYSDLPQGHWAYRYVLSATKKGWFVGDGDGDGRFRPDDDITRAEFVAVANRVLGRHVLPADLPAGLHVFDDLDGSHWAFADFMEAAYTHSYVRKADGAGEEWTQATDDGIQKPYNQ